MTPAAWERPSVVRRLHVGDLTIYATLVAGDPPALMLTCSKQGSLERGLLHLLGITASMALAHGVSLTEITAAWRDVSYDPSGFTGDKEFPSAKSITDLVARWLDTKAPAAAPTATKEIT